MYALAFDGTSACVVERSPPPTRARGEARLALILGGICNTDLELARGYMAFRGVLGHEFVAEVLEADDARLVGRRVVGGINCGCGTCERCANGLERHCGRRTVLGIVGRDGALAAEFTLPERNLVVVPDAIASDAAVFAEPLAAALRILEQVAIGPTTRVAVQGDGKLGVLCALALARQAASVTVFGRHAGRVPFPRNVTEVAADDRTQREFDVVVEATGRREGLEQALQRVVPLGTVVLKTTCADRHDVSLAPVVIDEVRVVGSRCGDMTAAMRWLESARLPVSELVAGRYALADARSALDHAARPGVLKVLVEGGVRS